jgi:hypothetical protein
MTNSSADSRAQESLDSGRKQFTRTKFAWLEQVAHDPELPASAFKVAWAISQHLNHHTSEAFPGTQCIAGRIAMSQGTVIDMVRRLSDAGHLAVDPGRRGRGHSNHYRMILKPQPADISYNAKAQPADISAGDKKAQPATRKAQPAELKAQPADMNTFTDTGAGLQPAPQVDRQTLDLHVQQYLRGWPDFQGDESEAIETAVAYSLTLEAGYGSDEIMELAARRERDSFDFPSTWLLDLVRRRAPHLQPDPMDDGIPI